jgi:hypothetical protein
MKGFQKMIVFAAIIILLIILVIIASSLAYSKYNARWPPESQPCPDYWLADISGNDFTRCKNIKNLGTCNEKEKIFSGSAYIGKNGDCNKYTWANKCGVSWDGITYGVPNPCNS